ncbi:hypothetical protein RirG_043800 [Rhizophagus irregularis DAOM 197198w]|uniref:YCII-related domain-containing protein n=1 Tax=Rhizophagus irregularis (strain DAOM 197198w) TaxID=1432141 RepID=A0A015K6L4_RHIIW|nr:hypothetical protein RirG_043800 [Rhizophagus irregularis DAOM 197198w]
MIFSRRVALFSFDAGWCFGRLYSTKFINKRNFSSNLVGRKQFLLLAKDYKDAEAYSRRLSVREEHLEKAKLAKERGFIIAGGAILENPEPNVVTKDYKDAEAYSRRLSVREEHLEKAKLAKERGFIIAGGAILENPEPNVVSSGEGKMVGSLFIFEAENEEQIRKEIERDPYVINKVWEKYEISPFKMAIK